MNAITLTELQDHLRAHGVVLNDIHKPAEHPWPERLWYELPNDHVQRARLLGRYVLTVVGDADAFFWRRSDYRDWNGDTGFGAAKKGVDDLLKTLAGTDKGPCCFKLHNIDLPALIALLCMSSTVAQCQLDDAYCMDVHGRALIKVMHADEMIVSYHDPELGRKLKAAASRDSFEPI